MATAVDRNRLRRDIGATPATYPDAEVDALYVEAGEIYTGVLSSKAYVRILALQGLVSSAAKLTSYRANNSQENASDVFDHLMKLLAFWQSVLDKAIVDEGAVTASTRDASLRIQVVSSW